MKRKIARYAPRAAAFLGKAAYSAITETKLIPWGVQAMPFAGATAWVVPPRVTTGKRADLILVADNPLQSLDVLKTPMGVMYGGHWNTASELLERLESNKRKLNP